MNKKGTDKIISVYWFAVLFIVAGGVVYMVGLFYGSPFDVRDAEANALADLVADCVAQGGKLKTSINGFDIEKCGLNFNVEDTKNWKNDQLFVSVNFSDFRNKGDLGGDKKGNVNLIENCNKEEENFPVCVERSFYALGEGGAEYEVKILSVVRKTEKNVR